MTINTVIEVHSLRGKPIATVSRIDARMLNPTRVAWTSLACRYRK